MDEEDNSWEEEQSMLDEESSYGDDQWSDNGSNTDFEEDPCEGDLEPVPPDPYHVDNHSTDCSRREAGLEEGYESGSWQEEAGVENCLENKEEWEHESDEETQLQLDVKEESWEAQTHPDSDQEIEESSWLEYHSLENNLKTWTRSKKADHPHSPQEVELTIEKPTIKQSKSSQPSSLQLPKEPEIHPRSKGTSENTESKATVVHIKGGPQPEDEAMQQGLQKPPASSNQNIWQGDGRPKKFERLKESQGQHLTCPQNVEEDARNNKSTQATKEQIILQRAETFWHISGTEAKDPIGDPHKDITSYSDQEDTNFKNRRFSSPSICEYPSLEAVSRTMKKRSDPKKLMEFNMDLLYFHKANNEEKRPREYGVMAQFPKPVKPVLQLPNLESHRFNLSQTKKWRPGEVY
ncbi:hypothetical protein F2Q69_00029271 [Brassica cretica]|uniref:Uncharacterized protein n=1 Tax=Brassica cretica TaxID=69181 RepID=A0A8S9RSJ2_BRACR|nr:hypothetical protein F2Q69_00029271 [Brassica cretica]